MGQSEERAGKILDLLNGTGIKNVVLAFHKTDHYGSKAPRILRETLDEGQEAE